MNKNLTKEEFSQIFINSYPTYVYNLQKKAFDQCVKEFQLPFLNSDEEQCIKQYSKKYLLVVDNSLGYFSKRIIE